MPVRSISQSEVADALSCQARWDFRYGGHLAGTALRPKRTTPLLSGGKAWGAALAAYHSNVADDAAHRIALDALDASLDDDAEAQVDQGFYDRDAHEELRDRLTLMLGHYVETAEPFSVEPDVEHEFTVALPARTGRRPSSVYRLRGFVDAWRVAENGRIWLVEFKLRNQLVPVEQIALSRQIRWYAWAWWRNTGQRVAGVEVVERWNEVPKLPRILKSGKPSHAKEQLCTADAYRATCADLGEEPNPETEDALARRRWQQRVPILFRDGELEEVGRETVAAARMIGQLDAGRYLPLRNPGRQCGWCAFRDICPAPDGELVDALYERVPPKRDRPPIEEETAA